MSSEPHAGQVLRDCTVGHDAYQIGSARDVSIGAKLPARPPLPDATRVDAPPGLIGLPRPPAIVFVGRDEGLERVLQALAIGSGAITQAAVYGLGGIGKSELALQHATRHRDRYRLVWWIDSDTPAQIQTGLAGLARAIVSGTHSIAAEQATVEEAAGWALSWLAAHPGWLLIFDNVEQVTDIEPYLGRLRGGRLLITTRRDIGWRGLCTPINLGTLAREDAVALLSDLIGPARLTPGHDLACLADELGHLPLALTQAGTYIARLPGMTVARYRELLHTTPNRIHAASVDGHDVERVIAKIWTLTCIRIGDLNALAVHLLSLLACFAPERLPVEVLSGLHDADQLDVAEALALLASYSMVTLTPDPAGDTVGVHRLVQAVTLAKLPGEQRATVRQSAADLLTAALPEDPAVIDAWSTYARLFPHARAALPPDSLAMQKVIQYLDASADYAGAKALQEERYRAIAERFGPEHPQTLTAQGELAYWIGAAGDPASARDQCAILLPVHESILGPDHPDTLTMRRNIAQWVGSEGDSASARDQCVILLPVHESILGPDHPDTLTLRRNIAHWTGEAGDPASARDQFAALTTVHLRVSGPDHFDTLVARANLAVWTGKAGDPASARDQLAALVSSRHRVLGPTHPYTMLTEHNLAQWTGEAGDPASARDQFAILLLIHERVLGPNHPYTLSARGSLAHWTGEAGDPASARDQFAALITTRLHVSGPHHPNTQLAQANLAHWASVAAQEK